MGFIEEIYENFAQQQMDFDCQWTLNGNTPVKKKATQRMAF